MFDPVREIVYEFVKGKGWVPTIERVPSARQRAKPADFGWTTTTGTTTNDIWINAAQWWTRR